MVTRRDFIKQTGMGAAALSMSGLTQCGSESGLKPVGGRAIDAHIHVVPGKVQKALQIMDENFIRYGVMIASIAGTDPDLYVGDKAFYELIEEAREDRLISEHEEQELHHLRKNIRNPYVHVKDVKIEHNKQNLQKPDFFTQYLKIKAPEVIGTDVEDEARFAIKVLITIFPKISIRMWG